MKPPITRLRVEELRVHGLSAAEAANFRKTLEREIGLAMAGGDRASAPASAAGTLARNAARQIVAKLPKGSQGK